jgi:hypothetical protein
MDPERWQRLRRLFEAARGLEPRAREALLDEACADDAGLRALHVDPMRAAGRVPTLPR